MATLASSPSAAGSFLTHNTFNDPYPKSGILLNAHEGESSHYSPPVSQPHSVTSSPTLPASATASASGQLSPTSEQPPSSFPPISPGLNHPPKIRFAPLPDPSRPRSLSTGRNVGWDATMEPNGERTRTIQIRGVEPSEKYDDDPTSDYDVDGTDAEGDDEHRGRSWSKTLVAGSWKGTKKLLVGGSNKEEPYMSGAPLKKSVSTGGFIGSSPFRWTSETERKKQFQGASSPSMSSYLSTKRASASAAEHRRNSSFDNNSGSISPGGPGSSPGGVRMLNGRIYGSRRASEAAEREKQAKLRRERQEPAFVEWGHGKAGGGMGSVSTATSSGGFLEEEGSGMEWVKRRREERQRREAEQRARQEESDREAGRTSSGPIEPAPDAALSSSASSSDSSVGPLGEHRPHALSAPLVTPNLKTTDLPPTPIIHISEATPNIGASNPSSPISVKAGVQPMNIKFDQAAADKRNTVAGRDVFDEDGSEEEEEEDDGDFEEDEDEEEEPERTTASAAGVEVISRHKT